MRIVLVAGLPGSGKTTLLDGMKSEGTVIVDDIVDLGQLPTGDVEVLAIADVSFCRTETRKTAEEHLRRRYPNAAVEWIFFENDPEACRANAEARADGRDVGPDISVLHRMYVVPEGATTMPVYRGEAPEPVSGP